VKHYKGEILCFIAATLFGGALLFQRTGGEVIPPFYLVAIRFFLGSLCIFPLSLLSKEESNNRKFIKYGVICGACLFLATSLQQIAIVDTPVGKAGFVASLYIFFIPIESFIIYKKKISPKIVVAIIVAISGSFLLYDMNGLKISLTDTLLVSSSIFYALQIVLVEKYLKTANPIKLALTQYLSCAIFSLIVAIFKETINISMISLGLPSIIYLGFVSCGVAYTAQMIGQRHVDSATAGLILSLESVISLIIGYVFLDELLTGKEMIGCILMLTAILISELPEKK